MTQNALTFCWEKKILLSQIYPNFSGYVFFFRPFLPPGLRISSPFPFVVNLPFPALDNETLSPSTSTTTTKKKSEERDANPGRRCLLLRDRWWRGCFFFFLSRKTHLPPSSPRSIHISQWKKRGGREGEWVGVVGDAMMRAPSPWWRPGMIALATLPPLPPTPLQKKRISLLPSTAEVDQCAFVLLTWKKNHPWEFTSFLIGALVHYTSIFFTFFFLK